LLRKKKGRTKPKKQIKICGRPVAKRQEVLTKNRVERWKRGCGKKPGEDELVEFFGEIR